MDNRFETFTVLVNRISRSIRRIKNLEMAEYGLRSAHISCLYHLYLGEGLTATELCERCEEDKATISRALLFLEEAGYVTCPSSSAKRYRSPLLLTEKGRLTGQEIAGRVDRVLTEVGEGLTESERVAFYRSLTIISDQLESIIQSSESRKAE